MQEQTPKNRTPVRLLLAETTQNSRRPSSL